MVEEDFTILEQVPSVVQISVGGQLFMTARSTLYQVPDSLLGRMFRGDVPVNKVKQTENVYFIDRDPKHFQRILNFMRDGACVIPASREDKEELLAEAQYYQLEELVMQVRSRLRDFSDSMVPFDFRSLVLRHHAETGNLESCLASLLDFVQTVLVKITPVTDVNEENRLTLYWLSASMPPANPSHVVFRYRGEKESNDCGLSVVRNDDAFAHWCRLWDIFHHKQLLMTFRGLALRSGLRITFVQRMETFRQDSQLDVVWKMYRVKSLHLSICPANPQERWW